MRINTCYDASKFHVATATLRDDTVHPENIAVASIVQINTISADEIDLDFEFTRPDGKIITRYYKGTYSDVSIEGRYLSFLSLTYTNKYVVLYYLF
tara:strand:- start:140 stop:427 length:288 start_codon:yes stop_codon:yes gene_type:complete